MSQEYQTDQRALNQYYQQMRIEELRRAREQQQLMMQQNSNRFIDMRNQFVAATSPIGAPGLIGSQAGFTGRNITLPGAGGAARQSLFGATLDANAAMLNRRFSYMGFSPFFRAGFQFNLPDQAVSLRAQQELGIYGSQIPNVIADNLLPDFAKRAFAGRLGIDVGFGNIQERSLGITDAFAGVRGAGASGILGRGISRTTAVRAQEAFTTTVNNLFDRRLTDDQIGSLQQAALAAVDSRDLAQAATGGSQGINSLLGRIAEDMQKVARNSGVSVEQLAEIATINKRLGNDFSDLKAASEAVNAIGVTSSVNRAEQLNTALQFTAQGRQLNVANAQAFGDQQLNAVTNLVDRFNSGLISRAELFRYGGENEFDAARRVQQRRLQAGQQFSDRSITTLGVLGADAFSSLQGGIVSAYSDIAGRLAENPFAGVEARVDFSRRDRLRNDSGRLALEQARASAALIPVDREETRDAFTKIIFGQLTGRDDLDAAREVDMLTRQKARIDKSVEEYTATSNLQFGSAASRKEFTDRFMDEVIPAYKNAGFTEEEVRSRELMSMVASDIAWGRKLTTPAQYRRMKSRPQWSDTFAESSAVIGADRNISASLRETAMLKGGVFANIETGKLDELISEAGLDINAIAEEIYAQTEGENKFSSAEGIANLLRSKNDEERNSVLSSLNRDQNGYMRYIISQSYMNNQINRNRDETKPGHTTGLPLYIKDVDNL